MGPALDTGGHHDLLLPPIQPFRQDLRTQDLVSCELKPNAGARRALIITSNTVAQLRQSLTDYLKDDESLAASAHFHQQQLIEIKENRQNIHRMVACTREVLNRMEMEEQKLRCDAAPVRRLSEEALYKTFQYVVQDAYLEKSEKAASWKRSKTLHEPPLLLGRVSSRWRSIIAASPSLWSTVHLFASRITDEEWRTEDQRLAHWLTFGDPGNIRLFIYDWTVRRQGFIEELLKCHSNTWKEIHICVSDADVGSWNTQALQADEVVVYICRGKSARHLMPLMNRAINLTVHGPPPEWDLAPWSRLRCLTLKDSAYRDQMYRQTLSFGTVQFAALLSAATELTELVLDFIPSNDTSPARVVPVIVHEKLEILSLHLSHFVISKGPFGVELKAPSLERFNLLSLAYKGSTEIIPLNYNWDLPKVLSLPPIGDSNIVIAPELLKWLPRVHTLEVTGRNVDALFNLMNKPLLDKSYHSNGVPAPILASIFMIDADVCGKTLIELLQSRMRRIRAGFTGSCAVTRIKKYDTASITVEQWNIVTTLLKAASRGTRGIEGYIKNEKI